MSKITRHKESKCPYCNHKLDASDTADMKGEFVPSEGDATICFYCTNILIYKKNLSLRKAEPEDLDDWPPDAIQKLFQAQFELREQKNIHKQFVETRGYTRPPKDASSGKVGQ